MQNLLKEFINKLEHLSPDNKQIAVAISGGSDSMALALLLGEYKKLSNTKIIALTVDHKLRPASSDEAKQVGTWLSNYDIEHHILCWEGDKPTSNIQAEARNARYRLMSDFCDKNNIGMLAVGHTIDDQAETLLMRIMRGSGVDGLAGISEESNIFGVKVIRPLLDFNREQLREYLKSKKQEWINDPSNENTKYARVRARNFIKTSDDPGLLIKRLADTTSHMARAKNYIEEMVRKNIDGIVTFHDAWFYTIDIEKFKSMHEEERLRALASALKHISRQEYKPRFENLSALQDRILNGTIGNGCTLWNCTIKPGKEKNDKHLLFIYPEQKVI